MEEALAERFADFIHAVHGYSPFRWQKRLAKEVFQDGWHHVLSVPTACGKTCALDLAIFDLARQAERNPAQRTAARRICFVVDRRLVVDEVTDHARHLRIAIQAAVKGERHERELKWTAERLATLAANPSDPLRVVRLRGGVYRDNGWTADPVTPTILISTVDQIGSRLLFRGYGISPESRPVHAALLAFDTLIILDEAHLSTVFASTLRRIHEYQGWAQESPLPHSRGVGLVCMSATIRHFDRPFALWEEERKDPPLEPRLDASKFAELIEVRTEPITNEMRQKQPREASEREKRNRERVVGELVRRAAQLAANSTVGAPRVIGIVVNRVATARQVFQRLRNAINCGSDADAILMTGRTRPFDRDRLLREWLPRMKADRNREHSRALFAVATQTIEVGANLDFDALVTEAAPLDALRQRFGRLDRLGKRHQREAPSPAVIVIRTDHKLATYSDPIYGSAIAETWKLLNRKRVQSKRKCVDFAVNDLDPKLETVGDLTSVLAPRPEDPRLFPAHLDAWVQTNPVPSPDPDVAPFLHGGTGTSADVEVVWRADLDPNNPASWKGIVALMPPRTREALPVPVYEARRWLLNEASAEIADLEGADVDVENANGRSRARRALRWRGSKDDKTELIGADELRPGDTVVAPASYAGADEFGWNPASSAAVADVAEECLAQLLASYPRSVFRRPKLRVRLHPRLFHLLGQPHSDRLNALLETAIVEVRADGGEPWPAIERLLRALRGRTNEPARCAAIDAFLQAGHSPQIYCYPNGDGLVLTDSLPVLLPEEQIAPSEEVENDEPEGDEASFFAKGSPVELSKHAETVERMSSLFADLCGLDKRLKSTLLLAARWHDEGKRDARFQAWLHGSELKALAALAADKPLAKSGRDPKFWEPSTAFGYPRGSRHEFVSVRLFEQINQEDDFELQLARLLIGTHHGHGRAFAPVVKDKRPVTVRLTRGGQEVCASSDHGLYRLDSGWADLFWNAVRRYGWWGLAYLEAVLAAADRTASANEQQRGNPSGGGAI